MSDVMKWMHAGLAKLQPYQPGRPIEHVAREQGLDPAEISKLASNENPLGMSRQARLAAKRCLAEMFRYPDGDCYYLREKLAAKLNVQPRQLIFGCGSNEIIEFIGHCFMAPGRSSISSQYAFIVYKLVAQMFGTDAVEVPAPALEHDMVRMAKAIRPDTSVVFICNPNNPTGTLVRDAAVRRFMDKVPEDVLVVFDEAYAEICLGPMPDTLRYVREGRPNAMVLRSFSKAYGLAGLRIGYGVAAEPLIQALEKARQPFNVNRLAQEAALAALDDDAFVRRSRALFRRSRAFVEKACEDMGLDYTRSYANFMLIKVGDAARVNAGLTKRGVIVRPVAGYGLPEYIRISYGTMPENEKLIRALREVMAP